MQSVMGFLRGMFLAIAVGTACQLGLVKGHGRLIEPPSRSSMWRYGYRNPPNYNDNQLYCGGVQIQYEVNKGRCGVCGDPFQGPLDNEPGGKYANGIIVHSATIGAIMPVMIEITASHKGYMEFRLCPNDDPKKRITEECLNDFLLTIIESQSTRYQVTTAGKYKLKLQLPDSVKCRACVLQWKYNTGNTWGVDPKTNKGCTGCGNQEQFYGCADIAIGHTDIEPGYSLITNQMSKGQPIFEPGVPTPPLVPTDTPDSGEEVDPAIQPSPCACECFQADNSVSSANPLQSYLLLIVLVFSYFLQSLYSISISI